MHPSRFDSLTRTFAGRFSRRGLLVVAAGGAVGMVDLAESPGAAAARSCPPCRKKKNGRCRKKRPDGSPCGNGGRCRNGRCDHNVCTLDCTGEPAPQACGPAGSSCQCVNVVEGEDACVKSQQGDACGTETVCDPGLICGIPCTGYMSFCWAPCV
jgi:hypothetical protein